MGDITARCVILDQAEVGFDTTANELSHYMNFALQFLLDPITTPSANTHSVQPWAHRFSHQRSDALFRSVPIPDTLPRLSPTFHTSEGDFLQLSGEYDYIVTLFFIDTSANIAATLLQIYTLLRPGGTWINLGPLLWASGGTVGMELSLVEVMDMIERVGFRLDGKAKTVECEYTQDSEAMFRRVYNAEFWVAKRPG
jgi:carnosine N-methyltransferase